jgi:hypothetical protein
MFSSYSSRTADINDADELDERWEFVHAGFMSLVPEELRDEVQRHLSGLNGNGEGLRRWLNDIAYGGRDMPESIPREVLAIYFTDHEALPLHDCADCGLPVPVRPNRLYGSEGDPEEVYFADCPACGGHTGLYQYWSNRSDNRSAFGSDLVSKPR